MSLETLAPFLLLAASLAAGLSGLLIHAQMPHDVAQPVSKPGDAPMKYRRFANALFVLSLVMLGWAGIWLLGPHASNLAGTTGHALHQVLVVGVAVIVGIANYSRKRRERAPKRDGR
ncbi:MAG TPA: hypothetical protein VN599_08545 [Rudaea sp.]|nr:hypothetical protein [Rudaea sp.]